MVGALPLFDRINDYRQQITTLYVIFSQSPLDKGVPNFLDASADVDKSWRRKFCLDLIAAPLACWIRKHWWFQEQWIVLNWGTQKEFCSICFFKLHCDCVLGVHFQCSTTRFLQLQTLGLERAYQTWESMLVHHWKQFW